MHIRYSSAHLPPATCIALRCCLVSTKHFVFVAIIIIDLHSNVPCDCFTMMHCLAICVCVMHCSIARNRARLLALGIPEAVSGLAKLAPKQAQHKKRKTPQAAAKTAAEPAAPSRQVSNACLRRCLPRASILLASAVHSNIKPLLQLSTVCRVQACILLSCAAYRYQASASLFLVQPTLPCCQSYSWRANRFGFVSGCSRLGCVTRPWWRVVRCRLMWSRARSWHCSSSTASAPGETHTWKPVNILSGG